MRCVSNPTCLYGFEAPRYCALYVVAGLAVLFCLVTLPAVRAWHLSHLT